MSGSTVERKTAFIIVLLVLQPFLERRQLAFLQMPTPPISPGNFFLPSFAAWIVKLCPGWQVGKEILSSFLKLIHFFTHFLPGNSVVLETGHPKTGLGNLGGPQEETPNTEGHREVVEGFFSFFLSSGKKILKKRSNPISGPEKLDGELRCA